MAIILQYRVKEFNLCQNEAFTAIFTELYDAHVGLAKTVFPNILYILFNRPPHLQSSLSNRDIFQPTMVHKFQWQNRRSCLRFGASFLAHASLYKCHKLLRTDGRPLLVITVPASKAKGPHEKYSLRSDNNLSWFVQPTTHEISNWLLDHPCLTELVLICLELFPYFSSKVVP